MSGLSTTRDITNEPSAFHTTQKNVKTMFSGNPSLVDLWKENGLDSPTENLTSVEDLNLDLNLDTNDTETKENVENSENVTTTNNENTEDDTLTKTTSELEEKTENNRDSGSKTETENREVDTEEDSIPPWMIFGGVTASVGILTALALRKRG